MILGKKNSELASWHLWFAWYPVELPDGRVVWLQTVERSLDRYGFFWHRLPKERSQ